MFLLRPVVSNDVSFDIAQTQSPAINGNGDKKRFGCSPAVREALRKHILRRMMLASQQSQGVHQAGSASIAETTSTKNTRTRNEMAPNEDSAVVPPRDRPIESAHQNLMLGLKRKPTSEHSEQPTIMFI
ncbi:hypothetical protein C0J52_00438 [Blattella germanica]|nr:hypothetical protein C0J52_00438 [Blattella germanica]